MNPKIFTGYFEGLKITTNQSEWGELLGIPKGSIDRVVKMYKGDMQAVIDAYSFPHWRERNKFIFSRNGEWKTL